MVLPVLGYDFRTGGLKFTIYELYGKLLPTEPSSVKTSPPSMCLQLCNEKKWIISEKITIELSLASFFFRDQSLNCVQMRGSWHLVNLLFIAACIPLLIVWAWLGSKYFITYKLFGKCGLHCTLAVYTYTQFLDNMLNLIKLFLLCQIYLETAIVWKLIVCFFKFKLYDWLDNSRWG